MARAPATKREYATHCLWLHQVSVPTAFDSNEWVVMMENVADANKVLASNYFDFRDQLTTEDLSKRFRQIRALETSHQKGQMLPANVEKDWSETFKNDHVQGMYKAWLKDYYRQEVKYGLNGERLTDFNVELTVEHTTPKDWMHLCTMCHEFRHAVNDPVMISVTSRSENSRHSTRPYCFVDNCNTGLARALKYNKMDVFRARCIAYASLTYPLIANANKQSKGPTPRLGVDEYADQLDRIVDLISQDVQPWELVINYITYALFRLCNPFVMSKTVRTTLKADKFGFKKLLAARFYGEDYSSQYIMDKWNKLNFKDCG